ncbi:hypothetical protein ON010_g3252 [Phytophthora cinnamomi]|nr:hypothetical protein ON010_g3252 [Phytophthora cinnamomi]
MPMELHVDVAGTLTKAFGEKAVAGVQEAGMKFPNTKALAEKLQGEQFRLWQNSRKSCDFFQVLGLKEAGNPLEDEAWRTY